MFSALLGEKINRPSVRSALLTRWFFNAASVLTGLFLQILIYEQFSDIATNITFFMIQHTALMMALCGVGWNAHRWMLTSRHVMQASAILLSLSFLPLVYGDSYTGILLFVSLYGMGQGLYWLSNNVYELTIMEDEERDVYASALVAGRKIIAIVAPFVGTVAVAAAVSFSLPQYSIVLVLSALCFACCIWATFSLDSYHFSKPHWETVHSFFLSQYRVPFFTFTAATAVHEIAGAIILPLVALYILGSAISVGTYATIASCIGLIGVYLTSFVRSTSSRLLYLWIGYGACVLSVLWLGLHMSVGALLIFMLVERTLVPLGAVSLHTLAVFSIERMSISKESKFDSMLFRDFLLWVWRMCGGLMLLVIAMYVQPGDEIFQIQVYVYALTVIFLLYAGVLLDRTREEKNTL